MPTLHSSEFVKPADWQEFQRMIKALVEKNNPGWTVQEFGTSGQK